MSLRLFIIRHGETEWSLSGRHTGRTELPLTAHGKDAARKIGPHLREIRLTRVLTSPRQRAQHTCALAGLTTEAESEADLVEWDYGDYEGLRSEEIRRTRLDWNLFHDGCPGGESPPQISDRADRLIARLRTLNGDIALFTHGHFGRVLGARWIGLPVITAQHFLLTTASLSVLSYEHDRADQPVIAQWNVAAPEFICPEPAAPARDAPLLKQRDSALGERRRRHSEPGGPSLSAAPAGKDSIVRRDRSD